MPSELFPPGSPDVLYIVDLSSYVLRAYHAIAPLSSPTGEPTHAVHGTVNMLDRLVRERRPALFAIAMDSGRETFRKEIYPEYKANRPPSPTDLGSQLRRCHEIVSAYSAPIWKLDGVEADDLIATAVERARAAGIRVVIVAADKDLMQLVAPDVMLWDTMRDRVIGEDEVEQRFGVKVAQLGDLFALMGDSSDNIPGVPHVGPKTAKELLVEYGTLEGIYAHVEQIKRKALRETLSTHRDDAFLSRRLVALKCDCELEFDIEKLAYGGRDLLSLKKVYAELGLTQKLAQIENELQKAEGTPPAPTPATFAPVLEQDYALITDEAALVELVAAAEKAGHLALAAMSEPANPVSGDLVGIALAVEPGKARYVPFLHRYVGAPKQLDRARALEILRPVLANANVKKLALDLKAQAVLLARHDAVFEGFGHDAVLASYLIDPEARHDRESLAERELSARATPFERVVGRGRGKRVGFDEVDCNDALAFAGENADFALRLAERQRPRLVEAGLDRLYDEMELPLARQLSELERRGVLVDLATLGALGVDCEREVKRLELEAHRAAGHEFNVNSPRQLETILFDELGLKPLRRTKTSRSTDAETLEALETAHELPKIVLEIRQITKLKGTYIDALPALASPKTGRIHTTWEQAVAATGRLSSSDPNLQNIPIRTELGRKIRAAFVPPPGHALVSADYSQIELRVLAHLSEDPVLLDAFRTGQDIHQRTAMEIWSVPEEGVTRELRTRAKAVNFGVIYGQGDSGLAKALGIPRAEAASFIAAYYQRYQGVQRFMNATLERARTGEAVRSILGRRRMVPNIRSGNRAERLAAERIAMNMPIQGSAADILKLAMLALRDPVTPGTRMILTVHDELVFEVPLPEVELAMTKIKTAMEAVYPLAVPLTVDVGQGPNWSQAH